MDSALPQEVAAQLEACNDMLTSLEERAKPFLNKSAKDIDEQLDPSDRAQVHVTLAHTLLSLMELYLKASGISPEDHDLEKEKDRLKAFRKKTTRVVSEVELSRTRRSTEVNVEALNRVITHAVPDLDVQQRAALKQGVARQGGVAEGGSGPPKKARREAPQDQALAFLQQAMVDIRPPG